MSYLDRENYKAFVGVLFLHAFGLLGIALLIPDDRRFQPFYWLWLLWPLAMAWLYSAHKFRWMLPVGVALPLWGVATWKFIFHTPGS